MPQIVAIKLPYFVNGVPVMSSVSIRLGRPIVVSCHYPLFGNEDITEPEVVVEPAPYRSALSVSLYDKLVDSDVFGH